jgi:uncharacterized protein
MGGSGMSRTSIPSPKAERLQIVDVLRGFALSALFLVHMLEGYELYWMQPEPSWASKAVFALFMGKSFPLLSIGFGFSFYMLIDRPGAKPSNKSLWFAWRLIILELIGYAHAMIYSGDIIEVLATLGLPLLLATRIKGKRILIGIAILCFLQPLQWWNLVVTGRSLLPAVAVRAGNPGVSAYLHGGLSEVVRANMWVGQVTKWHFMLVSGRISQIFGLYILGLVLGRTNFFSRLAELRRPRAMALIAGLVSILVLHSIRARVLDATAGVASTDILGAILEGWEDLAATACWGLVICALWGSSARAVLAPLANVGRATLTLYIMQSLIFIPLLYPFGAGLYRSWDGPTLLLVGIAAIAFQVCIANLWFGRFRYGPVEWAWRAATDLRVDIPFKRTPLGSGPPPELDMQPTPGN